MEKKLTQSQALGRALSVLRVGRGLGQRDVALAVKVSLCYVSLIENGYRNPSMRTLRKLAEVLKVPVGRVMELAEEFESGKWEKAA